MRRRKFTSGLVAAFGAALPQISMATSPSEASGRFPLWGGWSIVIPRSMQQRNKDGSWSAWGIDWSIDVQIIEATPPGSRQADQVPRVDADGETLSGQGWTGKVKQLVEDDKGRAVFRYAATMAATGTVMLCWVSYFDKQQVEFAHSIVASAAHAG